MCYTLFCYVRDYQCNPKGKNYSAVSTTFDLIVQHDPVSVKFFMKDIPTSWIKIIEFQ